MIGIAAVPLKEFVLLGGLKLRKEAVPILPVQKLRGVLR
jgi:hypothetical protein